MTYSETIAYLYQLLPVFHREGKKAYKADLHNTLKMCAHLGNPHTQFKSIHVAGTNGKGSTSHFLASILQEAGYKVGLYTSPHLKSFTERIKINGNPIPEETVVHFVEENKPFILDLRPSFFECTVGLAFAYFAQENVDIAVIEVGLGGRLDSTNVIQPELSLITNISFDHTDILGDTLTAIATEKAGIIKPHTPVVISEKVSETSTVFNQKASDCKSVIYYSSDRYKLNECSFVENFLKIEVFDRLKQVNQTYHSQLVGNYQATNLMGVLQAIAVLQTQGYAITEKAIEQGIAKVVTNTGLKGRWQILQQMPLMICDTAHNLAGITSVLHQLSSLQYKGRLWMILGFVNDKDLDGILSLLPPKAAYVFCQAEIPRALEATLLQGKAASFGLLGEVVANVNEAISYVQRQATPDDVIYIGGSTFVVAEIAHL